MLQGCILFVPVIKTQEKQLIFLRNLHSILEQYNSTWHAQAIMLVCIEVQLASLSRFSKILNPEFENLHPVYADILEEFGIQW